MARKPWRKARAMRARLRIMGWFIIGGILIITVFTLLVAKALALMVRGVLIVGVAARTTANARCTGEVRWG